LVFPGNSAVDFRQLVAKRIEPGLLPLSRVDLNQPIAGMLAECVFIIAGSVPFPT